MTTTDSLHQFTVADEARHTAGNDEWWQESIAFHWFDAASGVGGMHRIGHEPGQGDGEIAHHHGVFDATHRWRNNVRSPMAGQLDETWFGDADVSWSCASGSGHFQVVTDDCELDLVFDDLYPLTDFFPRDNVSLIDEFAAHHYETSGRVTGTARVGSTRHTVSGFGHRDHSWGIRKWNNALAVHRWVSGVIGPDLAFGSMMWVGPDGSMSRGGYVVEDGTVRLADRADAEVWLEVDGTTHRGGELVLTFGGEERRFVCRGLDGWLNTHHDVAWVDMLCEVSHDGRTGYCDFEISNNARMGSAPVRVSLRAADTNGLTSR